MHFSNLKSENNKFVKKKQRNSEAALREPFLNEMENSTKKC